MVQRMMNTGSHTANPSARGSFFYGSCNQGKNSINRMNLLNGGAVQNEWRGACVGRTGNVRFSHTAENHTCEDNVINRWHCTLSRLEYALRNKKLSDGQYVAPDVVDYPTLATDIINKLTQQSDASNLTKPTSLPTLNRLLQGDPSQRYLTVRVYIIDLFNVADIVTVTPEEAQTMPVIDLTNILINKCTMEQMKAMRTRLVQWCIHVYHMNAKMTQNINRWKHNKDINTAILNLVYILEKKEKETSSNNVAP